MEVHLDADARSMGRKKRKEKRRRPTGRVALSPSVVAEQTGRMLAEREEEWLKRLTSDPASLGRGVRLFYYFFTP
jgi:hypothetical protein